MTDYNIPTEAVDELRGKIEMYKGAIAQGKQQEIHSVDDLIAYADEVHGHLLRMARTVSHQYGLPIDDVNKVANSIYHRTPNPDVADRIRKGIGAEPNACEVEVEGSTVATHELVDRVAAREAEDARKRQDAAVEARELAPK